MSSTTKITKTLRLTLWCKILLISCAVILNKLSQVNAINCMNQTITSWRRFNYLKKNLTKMLTQQILILPKTGTIYNHKCAFHHKKTYLPSATIQQHYNRTWSRGHFSTVFRYKTSVEQMSREKSILRLMWGLTNVYRK